MSTTTTDPIADMLTRIRNAIAVRKSEVTLPHSNIKESVARLLKESNFIDGKMMSVSCLQSELTMRAKTLVLLKLLD